jgi:S-adenosyl-L-methionine hydrolase (adenosine-forming)
VKIITLTTDFGTADWFAGTMKGVILGIAPNATIVDLTHEIPPGDIRAGAFALAASHRFFPEGTVHVVVVDPGVGSARKAILAQTKNGFYLGPDNGVLSWVLGREKIKAIRQLENQKCFLRPVSQTFHGRDVFAPVAAHLSRGLPIQKLGSPLDDFVRLPWPQPRQTANAIRGEVVYIERFGNAITNIPNEMLRGHSGKVYARRKLICSVELSYESVRTGLPVAVPGSSGFLEIAVNGGSAASQLGLKISDPVGVRARR